jgi:hypothetical protein
MVTSLESLLEIFSLFHLSQPREGCSIPTSIELKTQWILLAPLATAAQKTVENVSGEHAIALYEILVVRKMALLRRILFIADDLPSAEAF